MPLFEYSISTGTYGNGSVTFTAPGYSTEVQEAIKQAASDRSAALEALGEEYVEARKVLEAEQEQLRDRFQALERLRDENRARVEQAYDEAHNAIVGRSADS